MGKSHDTESSDAESVASSASSQFVPSDSTNSDCTSECSETSGASGVSDSSLGKGQRLKKKKRFDDSLASELDAKYKSCKTTAPKHKSKKGKSSSKEQFSVPKRILKDEREVAAPKLKANKKQAIIVTSKQLDALENKQPTSKEMIAVEAGPSKGNDGQSPSKEYYKELVAKLMKEKNAEGSSSGSKQATDSIKISSSEIKQANNSVKISENVQAILDQTIFSNSSRESNDVQYSFCNDDTSIGVQNSMEGDEKSTEECKSQVGNDAGEGPFSLLNPKPIAFEKQLLFSKSDKGVRLLTKSSGIYVDKEALSLLKANYKSHTAFARALLEAVFTQEALAHCSLKGKMAKAPQGKPTVRRNALHPQGVEAILTYSRKYMKKKGREVMDEQRVRKQLGTKQSEIRSQMKKSGLL